MHDYENLKSKVEIALPSSARLKLFESPTYLDLVTYELCFLPSKELIFACII